MPQNKLAALHLKFQQGKVIAALDALEVCRDCSAPVPTWVIDALLAKREAVATSLKPPPQYIAPMGFDMSIWGGIDDRRGVESVPAGKGGRILGGRLRKELQRSASSSRNAFIAGAYRAALAAGISRANAITSAFSTARGHGYSVSRKTVARVIAELRLHKRVR